MKTRIAGLSLALLVSCGGSQPPVEEPPTESTPSETPTATAAPAPTETSSEATPPAAPTATETAAVEEEPPPGSPREKLMRAHFKETEAIRQAVINGRLAAAISPAKALTKTDGLGTIPPKWKQPLSALQSAAGRVSSSPDIPAVAAATADIGVACGSCHRANAGPKAKLDGAPAAGTDVKSLMDRHAWATERLWEGLYVPADDAWKAGAEALAEVKFPESVLKKGGVHGRSAADRMKRLLKDASGKKSPADRAKIYAALLETCSACHQAMQD
ncbi:MAG: hypothetical protein R3B13_06110 [Polyangiaceae bacterium]